MQKERAKAEAEVRAKADAEARAKAEAEVRAKAEVEARAKVRMQWTSGILSSPGMPKGWEKRLDHTTGTCKYIDHNTGNIYAQPPQSLFGSPGKGIFYQLRAVRYNCLLSLRLKHLYHNILYHKKSLSLYYVAKQVVHKTKLKDEGSSSNSGGLRRSHSSPNIAKLVDDSSPFAGDLRPTPTPSVDRVSKPTPR